MSRILPGNQFDEKAYVHFLVELACRLNARCGQREKPNGELQEYSGYSVRKEGLESAISSPFQSFGGTPRFVSPYDVAAALLINIATGHPFQDGNKRTALHLALTYLSLHSIEVVPPSAEAGAKLAEDVVINNGVSYEDRRVSASRKFQAWTTPDQTALAHRNHASD
ncbi:hypothetical protein VH13_09200 [Corynebacterium ulcerans]|uniref:type II toxin-antitoxin system death-on-curing family toxin n=1 Tax=Corynebacterium ulcerans TaxID=65058 RepID=UPI0006283E78|nr:Fic family protein [Corynebacterium ulcerans]KKO84896.1 hypothetical protein VH13_09200 [Corynebacterium ulcerans]KKO86914.1 hypothetical protein VH15_07845 [Corynebacterium ulcerans]KPJ23762.1 hypothetical protein AOT31_09565 [Corynebacterium ulcerans]